MLFEPGVLAALLRPRTGALPFTVIRSGKSPKTQLVTAERSHLVVARCQSSWPDAAAKGKIRADTKEVYHLR